MTCWNRLPATKECLPALLDLTRYPDWAVTVVEDCSTDGTRKWLVAEQRRRNRAKGKLSFDLILHDRQMGVNVSSNEAWALREGWYCKVDNNLRVLTPDWLSELVRFALDLGPKIAGAVGYDVEPRHKAYPPFNANGRRATDRTMGNIAGKCALVPEWTRRKLGFWNVNCGTPYRGGDFLYGLRVCMAKLKSLYLRLDGQVRRLSRAESGETRARRTWRRNMKTACRPKKRLLAEMYCQGFLPLWDWWFPI